MEISEKITASEMYENTRFNIELERERAKKKKRDSMTPQQLKEYRESLNLTQKEFSDKVGLEREKTISEYENGKKPIPKWLIKFIELDKKK